MKPFAAQSLAVMRTLEMDQEKVNVNGGAIALGHPLGCTGTKLTAQLIFEMGRRKSKYGWLRCASVVGWAPRRFSRIYKTNFIIEWS